MQTDITFEFNRFVIATTQLGIRGIDQAADFRISSGCIVDAQSFVVNTIVFIQFACVIYKLGSSWSFLFFCLSRGRGWLRSSLHLYTPGKTLTLAITQIKRSNSLENTPAKRRSRNTNMFSKLYKPTF